MKVNTKEELIKITSESAVDADLNYLDVSSVTDMSGMFAGSEFNGNISKWDTSSVTNMAFMFAGSEFNGDIALWDTSSVKDMGGMFENSEFNGDISKWDVSAVEDTGGMFDIPQQNPPVEPTKPYEVNMYTVSHYVNISDILRALCTVPHKHNTPKLYVYEVNITKHGGSLVLSPDLDQSRKCDIINIPADINMLDLSRFNVMVNEIKYVNVPVHEVNRINVYLNDYVEGRFNANIAIAADMWKEVSNIKVGDNVKSVWTFGQEPERWCGRVLEIVGFDVILATTGGSLKRVSIETVRKTDMGNIISHIYSKQGVYSKGNKHNDGNGEGKNSILHHVCG